MAAVKRELCIVVVGAALFAPQDESGWVSAQTLTAQNNATSETTYKGLPATGSVGRLKRGPDGKIVPIDPPAPPTATPDPDIPMPEGASLPGRSTSPYGRGPSQSSPPPLPNRPGLPLPGSAGSLRPDRGLPTVHRLPTAPVDPGRSEQEWKARELERDIQRVLRRERQARKGGAPTGAHGLTAQELLIKADLERRDREVRDHEQAHYQAASPHAQQPEYFYVTGPLGRRYAVSGYVRFNLAIDERDLDGTIRRLRQLKRAALAPRYPSAVDRRVAADIDQLILDLRFHMSRR